MFKHFAGTLTPWVCIVAGGSRMAGKYEIYADKSQGFRFRLKAGNGEVIATSESYTTKAAAQKGIDSVKNNAQSPVVDLTDK